MRVGPAESAPERGHHFQVAGIEVAVTVEAGLFSLHVLQAVGAVGQNVPRIGIRDSMVDPEPFREYVFHHVDVVVARADALVGFEQTPGGGFQRLRDISLRGLMAMSSPRSSVHKAISVNAWSSAASHRSMLSVGMFDHVAPLM